MRRRLQLRTTPVPRRGGALVLAVLVLVACGGGEPTGGSEAALAASSAGARAATDLDVLLITIDTLRADAVGASRAGVPVTPVIDRLAAGGVRFEQARAHNVVTLPSHASILSGRTPVEHGVRDNSGYRFPADQETLATILHARGYRTGAFVSAFPVASRFGLDRGFDVYEDSFVDAGSRPAFLEQERPARETVALAARWLAAGGEQPSFAWVHVYEPHFPYAPPSPFDRQFADDPYLGDVAAADAALEPLLEPILAAGADGNTLVVVTSDHGESLGEHGEATHGIFAYDSTLRVPLVAYQPRLLSPRVVGAPVGLVDVLPTVLDLLGVKPPAGVSGTSLAPLASGEAPPDASSRVEGTPRAIYFEALSGQLNRGWAPLFGVVFGGWKYVRLPIPELYDLGADPTEQSNLASHEPQRLRELEVRLQGVLAEGTAARRTDEDEETRRRLQSLGYVVAASAVKDTYTEDDDPKRLIGLDAKLRRVLDLYAAGDLVAARSACDQILHQRPDMRVALMARAQIARDLGDLDGAVAAMRQAHELLPEDTTTLALLVSYLTQAGRPDEAATVSAEHAAGERPDLEVLLLRSLALARAGRPAEARDTVEKAHTLEPQNPEVSVYDGTLALMEGRRAEARAAFEQALAENPTSVRAHTALAVLDTEEGRMDEAVEHWRRTVALDPREHAKLLTLGGRLWSIGQTAQAGPLLELFLESAPPDLYAREIESVRRILADGRGS